MKKVFKKALKNKQLAASIIGQVIVDEGYIGTDSIAIRYHSKQNAKAIWKIANRWNWTNKLQYHLYRDNRRPTEIKKAWRFNLKRTAIREIYKLIGPLPDNERDRKIRLALRFNTGKKIDNINTKIIEELESSPKTAETLIRKFKISNSAMQKHLRNLKAQNKINFRKINGYGKLEYSSL
jgi:hypothetical protein